MDSFLAQAFNALYVGDLVALKFFLALAFNMFCKQFEHVLQATTFRNC